MKKVIYIRLKQKLLMPVLEEVLNKSLNAYNDYLNERFEDKELELDKRVIEDFFLTYVKKNKKERKEDNSQC